MASGGRGSTAVALALAAWAFSACVDRDPPKAVEDAAVDASRTDAGLDASPDSETDAAPDDAGVKIAPRPLTLDFEEVQLPGDPKLLTDLAFVPGSPDQLLALERGNGRDTRGARVLHYQLA